MAVKATTKGTLDTDLVKAKAREQVAARKLERLKERYDKLKAITDTQLEKHAGEREKSDGRLQDALQENAELVARCKGLQDEAAMWKAQLFEQLDRLDAKQLDFQTVQTELAETQWQLVELMEAERHRAETALAQSIGEIDRLQKELVGSKARVDGLKNLGTCLAAKLDRATAQRKVLQRDHARLSEVAEMRANLLDIKDDEIEALKADLFAARGQLLSHKLDSQSWDTLKSALGEEPTDQPEALTSAWDAAHVIAPDFALPRRAEGRRQLKLAAMPEQSSPITELPKKLFKTVGSWFKLNSKG